VYKLPDNHLPKAPIERILRSIDPEIRVSSDAVSECVKLTVNFLELVAKKSIGLTKHAKRKTIKPDDIKFAFEELLGTT
jgi:histone H3/H4